MAVGERSRRSPLRLATLLTVLVALGLTAAAAWATFLGVRDQSRRLLKERTGEISLVLTQAIDVIPTSLQQLGAVLDASHGDVQSFATAGQQEADASPTPMSVAWLRPSSTGGERGGAAGGQRELRPRAAAAQGR